MLYIKIYDHGSVIERKIYFKDKQCTIIHREDGPAIEWKDGTKHWFINGQRHRIDGPAIEFCDQKIHEQYWINDVRYSEKEYWKIIKLGAFA